MKALSIYANLFLVHFCAPHINCVSSCALTLFLGEVEVRVVEETRRKVIRLAR